MTTQFDTATIHVGPSASKTERTITVTVIGGSWDQYDRVFDAVATAAHAVADAGPEKKSSFLGEIVIETRFDVTVSGQKVARR